MEGDQDMYCVTFPENDIIYDSDFAIRKFCPARADEQKADFWPEDVILNDIHNSVSAPCLNTSEIDEFVDGFINMDNYNDDENDAVSLSIAGVDVTSNVDEGLHLVHALLACAEAVGCRDMCLAESTMCQIAASASPLGDPLQRVSHYFADGLRSRLLLLQNVNTNGTFMIGDGVSSVSRDERMEAFRLLNQTTPFIAFGFMAANEAMCQSAMGNDHLHVVDLGSEHILQWPSLIRTLASRPEGPPKTLRITRLVDDNDGLLAMESLVDEAGSLGIALQFKTIPEPITPSLLTAERLGIREGETLLVNAFMHMHKFVKESRGSLKAILQAMRRLSPAVIAVVEPDANHNGPFFLGRFVEALHYYSAMFDALELSLARDSARRLKIEALHFGEEIRNIVACEGTGRVARHERAGRWRRQMGRAGLEAVELRCASQARMMLAVYGCDGYTMGSEKGSLLLGWQGRPLLAASAWRDHGAS